MIIITAIFRTGFGLVAIATLIATMALAASEMWNFAAATGICCIFMCLRQIDCSIDLLKEEMKR